MQETEFRSFEVCCITLTAHFVKKKNTLKSKGGVGDGRTVVIGREHCHIDVLLRIHVTKGAFL